MNPTQARQLIKDTFTQAFDKARFRTFAINLLNHVDEDKKGSMAVPDAFAAHVKSCQRLATYADPQGELLDVLIVHLTEDYKIERTRTALRDFVAHKLKRGDRAIRNEFEKKKVNTVDFAKKLMGQIVFLYFLQKKGWLGVAKGKDWGAGPRDFMRKLAKGGYGKYENFFNEILEPLFYDTLATDRGHEAWCTTT